MIWHPLSVVNARQGFADSSAVCQMMICPTNLGFICTKAQQPLTLVSSLLTEIEQFGL